MSEHEHITMTEDEFDQQYETIQGPEGSDWIDTSDFDWIKQFPENQRWTVVDTDEGQCIIPGVHFVNRVAYLVTKEAWPHESIDVEVDWPTDEEDDEPDCADFRADGSCIHSDHMAQAEQKPNYFTLAVSEATPPEAIFGPPDIEQMIESQRRPGDACLLIGDYKVMHMEGCDEHPPGTITDVRTGEVIERPL